MICASGIGDALLLHSVSSLLKEMGWSVVTFSDHLPSFHEWLPHFEFAKQPTTSTDFSSFDALFLQHDNSPKSFYIQSLPLPIYIFYGSHQLEKHGLFNPKYHFCADPQKTMVANLQDACLHFFGKTPQGNGLTPPSGLIHRKYPKRIAIHPTSTNSSKNWPKTKFLKTASHLEAQGFQPVFIAPPTERAEWNGPWLPSLSDLASFIYESGYFLGNDSGPAHLASYLQIPHLVIGGSGLNMPLWKTGWYPGSLLSPSPFLMHFKALRPHWHRFITVNKLLKTFYKLTYN